MSGDAKDRGARTFEVAERIRAILEGLGAPCAVIGAVALAVHGYARGTVDLDVGTATNPFTTLKELAEQLRREGFDAELVTPDADDPLGGVVNVRGPDFDLVQVVNFVNPLGSGSNPGSEAIDQAKTTIEGTSLRVVEIPHLVALKLYAGGLKSRVDVVELLRRNPAADRKRIGEVCAKFGLAAELDAALKELGTS